MVYSAISDIGKNRKVNEDSYAIIEESGIFVIADGMGGHNAGEVASRLVVDNAPRIILENTGIDAKEAISKALNECNREIFNLSVQNEKYAGMGTTADICLIRGTLVYIGHIGDSRVYKINRGRIKQITNDHSVVAMLLKNGSITPEEAANHPSRNVITRAVGTEGEVEVDIYEETAEDGDIFLMCTDGLTGEIDDDEILKIVSESETLDEAASSLVMRANQKGGNDNITVVLFKI